MQQQVRYDYGTSVYNTRAAWVAAMVDDWLAGGEASVLFRETDEALAADLVAEGWLELPEVDDPTEARQPAPPTVAEVVAALAEARQRWASRTP